MQGKRPKSNVAAPSIGAAFAARQLPDEIALNILAFLPPICLGRLSRVSKYFYKLSTTDMLWKAHVAYALSGSNQSLESIEQQFSSHREFAKAKHFWREVYLHVSAVPDELRVVVCGIGGVGKSALTIQFIQGVFILEYDPIIEDCYRKQINVCGHTIVYDIHTAGKEEYSSMREWYMRAGGAFLLVFAVDDEASLHYLDVIYEQIYRVKHADDHSVPMILVGNKCDLRSDPDYDHHGENNNHYYRRSPARWVTKEQAEKWAADHRIPYIETSAKQNINVTEAFVQCAHQYMLCKGRHLKYRSINNKSKKNKRCNVI